MHFVTCTVRLAGDMRNEVVRDAFNPVSYPEVSVLQFIHGDDAVLNIKPIAAVQQSARAEKERLALKYGTDVLEAVFPGKNPSGMELEMPKAVLPEDIEWRSPLDVDPAGFDVDPTPQLEAKAKQAKSKAKVEEPNPFAE